MTDVSYRPAVLDDAPAMTALLNARDTAFYGSANHWEETIRGSLQGVRFDLADFSRVAVAPDGSVIGFVIIYDNINPLRADLTLLVDSRWHDAEIGTSLLDWAVGRTRRNVENAPDGVQVSAVAQIHHPDTAGIELFSGFGFKQVRTFYTMRLDFDGAPNAAPLPEGFRLVSYAENPDLRAFLEVDAEAFSDHWGETPSPIGDEIARWQHVIDTAPDFDPNLWWLAYYGDQPAGLMMNMIYSNVDEGIAWVSSLGVLKPYRKRGLALAMLGRAFTEMHARGRSGIGLGVDGGSQFNAVALYERAGMHIFMQRDVYELILRDGVVLSVH